MKRIAIFGATGYTGFELIRMLLSHPGARISVLTSEQYSDLPLAEVFPPFKGRLEGVSFGKMEKLLDADVDVAFLALPHTLSSAAAGPLIRRGVSVVDLSADFRSAASRCTSRYTGIPQESRPGFRSGLRPARGLPGGDPEDAPRRRSRLLPHLGDPGA